MHTNLSRRISAGEIIKPWLILGPFYEDLSATVQGLTLFEKPGAEVGRTAMTQIVGDAQAILRSQPHEGEEMAFRGQTMRWELVRMPENYLSWGRYNISNHLGAAFLTTIITPEQPGAQRWRLVLGITSRAIVAINGAIVYDTDAHPGQARRTASTSTASRRRWRRARTLSRSRCSDSAAWRRSASGWRRTRRWPSVCRWPRAWRRMSGRASRRRFPPSGWRAMSSTASTRSASGWASRPIPSRR